MQACTGAASQLWRVDPSSIAGFVRLRSDTGHLCLTLDGASGSDALATPCSANYVYLPLALNSASAQGIAYAPVGAARSAPAAVLSGVRDFYMGSGGMVGVPSLVSDSLCLDAQDVWDSDFTAGLGGPEAGQRGQFFKCYDTQLNQKWSFSGSRVSGNKCLALAGSAVTNGAGALVARCNASEQQDWDYHW